MFTKQLHPSELACTTCYYYLYTNLILSLYLIVGINKAQIEEDKYAYFFLFWALKESYVKAIGSGIADNLASICFIISDDAVVDNNRYCI